LKISFREKWVNPLFFVWENGSSLIPQIIDLAKPVAEDLELVGVRFFTPTNPPVLRGYP